MMKPSRSMSPKAEIDSLFKQTTSRFSLRWKVSIYCQTPTQASPFGLYCPGQWRKLQPSLQSTHRPASSCECGAAVASLVDVDTCSIPVHQSERPRRKWLFELSILNVPIESVEKRTPKAVWEKPCLGLEKSNDLEVQAILGTRLLKLTLPPSLGPGPPTHDRFPQYQSQESSRLDAMRANVGTFPRCRRPVGLAKQALSSGSFC